MFTRIPQLARYTAALLAVLVVVPAASAGRFGPGSSAASTRPRVSASTCHQYCGAVRPRVSAPSTPLIVRTETVATSDRSFQWLDAAIGFGVGCGVMLLAASAFIVKRRARVVPAGIFS
jgi:hypothetical protein